MLAATEMPLSVVEAILIAQIILLLMLYSAIAQIHKQLRTAVAAQLVVSGSAAPAIVERGRAPAVDRPTVGSLMPEVVRAGWQSPPEWEVFTAEEIEVLKKLHHWLGPERLLRMPLDLIACFLRGYAYRADRAEASCAFMDRAIDWREECGADTICLQLETPPRRALFEDIVKAGPIGFDQEGHPLILERLGAVQPSRLLENFDEASFLRHQCYSREALRFYATANCIRRQKRLYKTVAVIDMAGLSLSHTNTQFIKLLKTLYGLFGWHYPESIHKFYVINAPWLFRTVWAGVKVWLHPITASKLTVVGSNYLQVFEKAGLQITGGKIPQRVTTWSEQVRKLVAEFDGKTLAQGYMPEEDLAVLSSLG